MQQAGASLTCRAQASHCSGFSWWWCVGFRHVGFSSCSSQALGHRLCYCGAQAQLPKGMWDPPRPGIEPTSPALTGRCLSTAPPGKSCVVFKNAHKIQVKFQKKWIYISLKISCTSLSNTIIVYWFKIFFGYKFKNCIFLSYLSSRVVDADESAYRKEIRVPVWCCQYGIGGLGVSLVGFPPIETLSVVGGPVSFNDDSCAPDSHGHLPSTPGYLGGSATVELVQGAHPWFFWPLSEKPTNVSRYLEEHTGWHF